MMSAACEQTISLCMLLTFVYTDQDHDSQQEIDVDSGVVVNVIILSYFVLYEIP